MGKRRFFDDVSRRLRTSSKKVRKTRFLNEADMKRRTMHELNKRLASSRNGLSFPDMEKMTLDFIASDDEYDDSDDEVVNLETQSEEKFDVKGYRKFLSDMGEDVTDEDWRSLEEPSDEDISAFELTPGDFSDDEDFDEDFEDDARLRSTSNLEDDLEFENVDGYGDDDSVVNYNDFQDELNDMYLDESENSQDEVTDVNARYISGEQVTTPEKNTPGQIENLEQVDAAKEEPREYSVFGSGSFAALGIRSELCTALNEFGITNPTKVQQRGIPAILGGVDIILGAATGSGKTYAYLLPVISMMKVAEEMRGVGDPPLRVAHRPRSIVLLPTRELAEQVLSVSKALSHRAKFRVLGTNSGTGSTGLKKLKDVLARSPTDILVSTTGRLIQLLDAKVVDLRSVKHVIIDEVDTLFDEGFGPELDRILQICRSRGNAAERPQFIAVGATHPNAAEKLYKLQFPSAKRINVDLHVAPPGLDARFIHTTPDRKLQELTALLGESKKHGHLRGGRIIIFCNTIDSARFVEHFLSESGYTTASVHGNIPPHRRQEEFQAFKNSKVQLLVCTDVAARGLDNLDVAHVVLFDFPTSAVDYIHRAGRTARAGAKGRVTSFVLKRDLALARAVEQAGTGKSDALVSARIAREEEKKRRMREEADRRALQDARAEDSENVAAQVDPKLNTMKRYPRSPTSKVSPERRQQKRGRNQSYQETGRARSGEPHRRTSGHGKRTIPTGRSGMGPARRKRG